ncbi:MAG: hypothetical protein ACOZQL_09995, partial [Myxococcota bacterium]
QEASDAKTRDAEAQRVAAADEEATRLQMLENARRKAGEDPEAVDAGPAPVAAAIDAGVPSVVAAVVDAGPPQQLAPAEERESGPPWALIAGAGGVAALVFLVVVARKRSRPPTLDD